MKAMVLNQLGAIAENESPLEHDVTFYVFNKLEGEGITDKDYETSVLRGDGTDTEIFLDEKRLEFR